MSPLTSRRLDQLSVRIVLTHYAADDYVTRWSISNRNCPGRSTSIFKLWRHDYDVNVTRRHRWRHHSTAPGHFYRLPI